MSARPVAAEMTNPCAISGGFIPVCVSWRVEAVEGPPSRYGGRGQVFQGCPSIAGRVSGGIPEAHRAAGALDSEPRPGGSRGGVVRRSF